MALVLADRVRETTTTAGTGTITLLGAVPSCQSFAVVGNGNTTYYTIVAYTGTEYEVGIGTYTSSGTTLSRDTVLASSNGGSLVNFSAGTKDVFVDYPAGKAVYEDAAGNVDGYPITGGTINNTTVGATTPSTGKFTDASVTTASGESSFNENDTITGWIYSGNSFSVTAEETAPTGLFIGSNGTKMYVNGSTGDDVNEYTLSTAWDITTATFVTTFSTSAQDSAPQDIFFKPDGLTMFVLGSTNDTVFQYTLTIAWDVSSASYASKSFSVTTQETTPLGLWFKPDGLVMYVVGSTFDTVFQYALGTAWDVSTASYGNIFYSVAAQDSGPVQINLSADGTKMWMLGSSGDDIWEYTLGTAWNVSTATPVNNFYIGFQETTPAGMFIDSTASNRVYVVGSGLDRVFQYYTAANSLKLDTQKLYIDGQLSVNENFVAGQNAYVDGALTVQGAVTLGSLTVGSTTITGTTNLATSTAAQTVSLGAGATISGALKTINIGTSGVSGSTTNINIGSAVSGSLGDIVANGAFTATGRTSLGGVAGSEGLRVLTPTLAGNYAQINTNNFGDVIYGNAGSGTNIPNTFLTKGTGVHKFSTNNSVFNTQAQVSHTASAVNYHQLTGSATGSGPVHSVAGSDTNIDLNLTTKGTGGVNLNTGGGIAFKATEYFLSGTTANYIFAAGRQASNPPVLGSAGSDTNVSLAITSKGTGSISLTTSNGGLNQFLVAHTASAVNYVQVTGSATGASTTISSQGSDTNLGLNLSSKGTRAILFYGRNFGGIQFATGSVNSAVNYFLASGATAGNSPVLLADGSDTNISAVLQPKGTGALQAQQTDSTATGGNARGARAVDWQTLRNNASEIASGFVANITGGYQNTASGGVSGVLSGTQNNAAASLSVISGGIGNTTTGSNYGNSYSFVGSGYTNTAGGVFNFIGGGYLNSGTSATAVTTQSATMNATTAVTLAASNASIKVGQIIAGTSISSFPPTYVAAVSGTSLTLSQAASGSSTSTLSFFTPHGVVVGGGNNQATGSYSFIGGGGDAGTASNRNVASGDWSFIGGGKNNTASGIGSVVAGGGTFAGGLNANIASAAGSTVSGGASNTASGFLSNVSGGFANASTGSGSTVSGGWSNTSNSNFATVLGGTFGTTRSIIGSGIFAFHDSPVAGSSGVSQGGMLIIGRQTTDATATVLTSNTSAAGTTNQVILPNNSAYAFKGTVIANVTGGGNTKAWAIEGAIKRGANAASTALVGTPTVTSAYADVGAATWAITATADTTNGGLAITFTGQASTTIRVVAKLETTEVTF